MDAGCLPPAWRGSSPSTCQCSPGDQPPAGGYRKKKKMLVQIMQLLE